MTADKRVEFQVCLSHAETEATTQCIIADTDLVVTELKSEIYGITSNEQMHFKIELSNSVIEYKAWWWAIGIQEVRKTIEQCVIHFGYPKMHHVSHISE